MSPDSPRGNEVGYSVPPNERQVIAAIRRCARAGHLDDAAARLHTFRCLDQDLEQQRLDLLARVEAQRGHYISALNAWQRVLEMDPENANAATALSALRTRMQSRSIVHLAVRVASAFALLLLVGAILVWNSRTNAVFAALRADIAILQAEVERTARESNAANGSWHRELARATNEMATSLAHASDVENANRAELRAICGHLQDALASFSATVTDRYAILEDAVRATTTQLGTVQNRADALCNAVLAAIVQCQKSLEGESRLAAARLESVEESRQQRDNAIQQLLTECTKSYAQQILNALHQLETRVQELETTLSKLAASRMIGEPQGAKGNGPPK